MIDSKNLLLRRREYAIKKITAGIVLYEKNNNFRKYIKVEKECNESAAAELSVENATATNRKKKK